MPPEACPGPTIPASSVRPRLKAHLLTLPSGRRAQASVPLLRILRAAAGVRAWSSTTRSRPRMTPTWEQTRHRGRSLPPDPERIRSTLSLRALCRPTMSGEPCPNGLPSCIGQLQLSISTFQPSPQRLPRPCPLLRSHPILLPRPHAIGKPPWPWGYLAWSKRRRRAPHRPSSRLSPRSTRCRCLYPPRMPTRSYC